MLLSKSSLDLTLVDECPEDVRFAQLLSIQVMGEDISTFWSIYLPAAFGLAFWEDFWSDPSKKRFFARVFATKKLSKDQCFGSGWIRNFCLDPDPEL